MELQINPRCVTTRFWVGEWRTPLIMVDDYLGNVEALREYALSLSYGPSGDSYPGLTAQATLAGGGTSARWIGDQMIAQLFDDRPPHITTAGYGSNVCRFAVMACNPARLPKLYLDQHADSTKRWLATVLHLSHDTDGRGTALWQHRPSGMQSWFSGDALHIKLLESLNLGLHVSPQLDEALRRVPVRSAEELSRLLFRSNNGRKPFSAAEDSEWHLLHFVAARFNRLVVYPTWQIHSLVDEFAQKSISVETMRLTMNQYVDYPVPTELGLSGSRPTYSPDAYTVVPGLCTC